jgi:tetratricopeptide (TPR) repeat protein
MNVLKEAVYRAVHGEGGLVFVHGEAGIGKTRLVRELGAYARSRGVQVLYGRCPALFRMDGVPPYILWKEVIKDYLEICTPEQLNRVIGFYPAEVAKLVPELSQKLRAFPQSFPISPEQEQNRLFEAVSQFITNISREAPLLVVLDDLQWTDPSSLLLLHYLARGVQKTSLLLLGAYRSTDIDDKHPLTPVLAELNRERLPQEVQLKRMSFSDVSEMVKNILEQDDVPEEFCKLVYDKTRGNPFFVEEVVKSLKEEETIYLEEGRWKFKEISAIEFPKSVKNVVKARISRLDEESQNVLTMASFIGNDFTFEAICSFTGIEKNTLLKLMDKLFKTGLIKERVIRGEAICSFADIIVRDVVYEEVSPLTRKELHGVVGRTLEKVYAKTIDEHLGELASHFLESGDKDKALDYFLKAGEKATGIYANAEAASYLQSALGLLEEKGELREKGRVLEKLGDLKGIVGEPAARLKYWNEALQLWSHLNEKEKVAGLHRRISYVLFAMGDIEKAREHLDKASESVETMPESVELAKLYIARADEKMWYAGDMAGSRSWAEKALALAEKLGNFEVIADSYLTLGNACFFTRDQKKASECFERALKIALDKNHVDVALVAYFQLALEPSLKIEKRIEYFEKHMELSKKAGFISSMSWSGMALASLYAFYRGNMKDAVSLAEESVALSRKVGYPRLLSLSTGYLGWICMILGELDKSEQYFKEAFGFSQIAGDFDTVALGHFFLGSLHFEKGEYNKAREHLEKANEIYEKVFTVQYSMSFLASQYLIWTYIELEEIDKAQNLVNNLHKIALDVRDEDIIANSHALTAMVFRAQKKWKESIEHFEESLQKHKALNARQWDVYNFAKMVLCEYARMYLERNEEGDKEKARDLLNQALEMFQKMGAKKDIEKVEAKLLYIETGKAPSVPKPKELVATGYADLDKLLHGGIPSNYAVLLTSPPCDERDLLIKSFLETGAKKGEITFYVTTDPSSARPLTEDFQSSFCLFVCNPQADAIVESSPNVFKLKGVENLTEISIALTSAIRRLDPSLKGPRRICVGLVSDVLLQHHAVQTRKWLTALITELKPMGFTTLAVIDPQMHPSEELHAILGLFDGEINIYEKGAEQFLKIKRMSDQEYLEDELPLTREGHKKQR